MSITETSSNSNQISELLHGGAKINENALVAKRAELQTNILSELGTNRFTRTLTSTLYPKRSVALRQLKDDLGSSMAPKQSWLNDYLPQSTQKLLKEYLSLFESDTLSEGEFKKIWEEKGEQLGEGANGTVYASKDGKYALKLLKDSESSDRGPNETLINNSRDFDPKQYYYRENDGFITKYVCSFKTDNGESVDVFEKINGEDFDKCNAQFPAQQCRLLAQAATAIAISHEAGCINSDIKPQNMRVTKDFSLLKLIDQGELIDLTQSTELQEDRRKIVSTVVYAPPEMFHVEEKTYGKDKMSILMPNPKTSASPAFDVFELGVTILQKLCDVKPRKAGKEFLEKFLDGFYLEFTPTVKTGWEKSGKNVVDLEKNFSRKAISETIASKCEVLNLFGTPEESKFIGRLLQDCLAYKPEDRISAAQVAEILQVFSSYLENPIAECPNYDTVKAIAIEDCPKGIPIALRKMLFHSDPEIQKKAISIIGDLVKVDPSYKSTPSYGMVLLLQDNLKTDGEQFQAWVKQNPRLLQELKNRTYIFGNDHYPDQDMPISAEIYRTIQNYPPKDVPIALRKMLFHWASEDQKKDISMTGDVQKKDISMTGDVQEKDISMIGDGQKKAISMIGDLVKADPSYTKTPSYGMSLLFQGNLEQQSKDDLKTDGEQFQAWVKQNPQPLQQLKDRTYVLGRTHRPDQDMPVLEKIYEAIQKLA